MTYRYGINDSLDESEGSSVFDGSSLKAEEARFPLRAWIDVEAGRSSFQSPKAKHSNL